MPGGGMVSPPPGRWTTDPPDVDLPAEWDPASGPPRPIVWAALTASQAESAWLGLNEWVEKLRYDRLIPAAVIPPFWHRHQVLVEHLTALWTHYRAAYDDQQHGSAPFGFTRDLDEWKNRMRETVAQVGCRIDSCRPEQILRWPGEPEPDPASYPPPVNLANRYDDIITLILWDVRRRHLIEQQAIADAAQQADLERGE